MKSYTRIRARIDLDAIEYNIEKMKENLPEDTKLIVVAKADCYGHGALQTTRLLSLKEYVWGFAVATLDEAIVLRRGGITKPILVLGCIFPEQWIDALENNIRITVYAEELTKVLSDLAVKIGRKAYVHVKLDTGMGRIGFTPGKEGADKIEEISKLPNIVMEGLYTHFSKADEGDKSYTLKQMEAYTWMKEELAGRGITFSYYHCCNSAGIIDLKGAGQNLARAGISTYGMYPSEEVHKENVDLKPALELISHVAFVKWVDEGKMISYGGTYVTKRRTKIATIPVGYGDGYPRSLSNKGYMLIHGKKAPIIGRVCMDQCMVDVTEIEDVKFGDEVVLVGRDGDEYLSVETLSRLSDRFNYEFVCLMGKRIPREYIRRGEIQEQMDYFA
jgi:alanine racemase